MTALGSAPHHDRVLVVVLVMPEAAGDPDVQIVRVPPNSPHAEAFWHDAGRPAEGPERTPEAPADACCSLRACPTADAVRFLKRHSRLAREPNGCILWAGAKDGRGYGAAGFAGKTRGAHRITAHLFLGMPLDYPGEVCHRCDTPACVAPGCLFLGTHKDNMADASAKGRMTGKRKPVAPWKPTHAHLAVMQENLDRLKAGLPALARQDLIERLGPLPEPIPEEGP